MNKLNTRKLSVGKHWFSALGKLRIVRQRNILFLVGVIISLISLYLSFRKIDFVLFIDSLVKLASLPILLSILFAISSYIIRAIRWKYILVNPKLEFYHLFSASMIGNMGNNIFPMRIGEIIRCYVLGYQTKISKSTIFASVVLERVLDGITVLILFTVSLLFANTEEALIRGAIVASLLFGTILLVLIYGRRNQEKCAKVFLRVFYFFPEKLKEKLKEISESFFSGLNVLHSKKYLIISILYSSLFWGLGIMGVYFVLLSTGESISINMPVVLTFALVLGVMIPSAPGFVGIYHYIVVVVLSFYGWDKATAVSIGFVLHGIQFILPIILGIFFSIKLKLNIISLARSRINGM